MHSMRIFHEVVKIEGTGANVMTSIKSTIQPSGSISHVTSMIVCSESVSLPATSGVFCKVKL